MRVGEKDDVPLACCAVEETCGEVYGLKNRKDLRIV